MSYAPMPPENNTTIILLIVVSALVAIGVVGILFAKLFQHTFQ